MLSEPVAWAGNAITHYLGLWSWAFATPVTRKEFQSYIDGAEPNPLFERISPFRPGVPAGSWSGFAFRVAMGIPALGHPGCRGARGVAASPHGRVPTVDWRLRPMGALAVHSHLLFVGTFGVDGPPAMRTPWRRWRLAAAASFSQAGYWIGSDGPPPSSSPRSPTGRGANELLLPPHRRAAAVSRRRGAIAGVVTAFRHELPEAQVYVYDNGSTDATAERAADAGAVVRCPSR